MQNLATRRDFLKTAASASLAMALGGRTATAADGDGFSFVLLGDLHYDRLEHHDMGWLEKNKAGDLSQIRNYSRITADITPRLFATVRETIVDRSQADARPAFVLQVGDLVEGLCATEALAVRQDTEALEFIRGTGLGVPFVFTKGNHDVTGDGATEAFDHVFAPFLREQSAALGGDGKLTGANYALERGGALFCFFDAYDKQSLDWLEATLAKRTARHCFVVIHPPVVPYGARSTWHLFANAKDAARREKLLGLLGRQHAFVLGGHIHRYNTLTRTTPGGGRFVQLAVSSVVPALEVAPKTELSGIAEYTGDQIRVEPAHSPGTEIERRAVYDSERKSVTTFQYADLPGYAVVTVRSDGVVAEMYAGASRRLWKTASLSALLKA